MLQGFARLGALAALLSFALAMPARAEDWQPVSPEELQMKDEPKAPKAAAIFLYRQVDRDDANSTEAIYSRIKILTDEGRQARERRDSLPQGRQQHSRAASARHSAGRAHRRIRRDGVREAARQGTRRQDDGEIVHAAERGGRQHHRIPLSPDAAVRMGVQFALAAQRRIVHAARRVLLAAGGESVAALELAARPAARHQGSGEGTRPDPPRNARRAGLRHRGVHAARGRDEVSRRVHLRRRRQRSERARGATGKRSPNVPRRRVQRFIKADRALEQEVARLVQPGDSSKPRRASCMRAPSRFATFHSSARPPSRRRNARSSTTTATPTTCSNTAMPMRTKSRGSTSACCAPRSSMPRWCSSRRAMTPSSIRA